jgi:hypothetical protein
MKAIIEYLIRKFLKGYHLARNPSRKLVLCNSTYTVDTNGREVLK